MVVHRSTKKQPGRQPRIIYVEIKLLRNRTKPDTEIFSFPPLVFPPEHSFHRTGQRDTRHCARYEKLVLPHGFPSLFFVDRKASPEKRLTLKIEHPNLFIRIRLGCSRIFKLQIQQLHSKMHLKS